MQKKIYLTVNTNESNDGFSRFHFILNILFLEKTKSCHIQKKQKNTNKQTNKIRFRIFKSTFSDVQKKKNWGKKCAKKIGEKNTKIGLAVVKYTFFSFWDVTI